MSAVNHDKPLELRLSMSGGGDALAAFGALRQGPRDPQMRRNGALMARAMRLSSGPVTLEVRADGTSVAARAWGAGADQALTLLPELVGELDEPPAIVAHHPILAELLRRAPGLRLTRGSPVLEVLVPAILAQKVTGLEARRAHRCLLSRYGEAAPGPHRLTLPPPPQTLARLPYWAFHPLGVERRRADTIRAAAAAARRLEHIRELPRDEAAARLTAVPGIGPWTAAETMRLALGDPDAVSLGDYHLPNLVCWVLAREARGDDARMLELLEPYRGQRARVILLIERSGLRAPRFGPRLTPRSIATC